MNWQMRHAGRRNPLLFSIKDSPISVNIRQHFTMKRANMTSCDQLSDDVPVSQTPLRLCNSFKRAAGLLAKTPAVTAIDLQFSVVTEKKQKKTPL